MKHQLDHLINIPKLSHLCKNFARIHGVNITLSNLNNCVLITTEQPIVSCDNEKTTLLNGNLNDGQAYRIYLHHNNLCSIAVPVKIGGYDVAIMEVGQFCLLDPDIPYTPNPTVENKQIASFSIEVIIDVTQYLLEVIEMIADLGQIKLDDLASQQNRSIKEINQLNEELEAAQHLGKMGSWRMDHKDGSLKWSKEIYRIFEIHPDTFSASYDCFLACVHPEDKDIVDQTFKQSIKTQEPYDIVHRLLLPDEKIKYVHERGNTHYDRHGQATLSIGTVQDITTQELQKLQLTETIKRLELTKSVAQIGVWVYDCETDNITWDDRTCQMYGIASSNNNYELSKQDWLTLIHADDSKSTAQQLNNFLNGSSSFDCYYRILLPDQTIRHLYSDAYIERDTNGTPVHVVGINLDVSKTKQAEERIRRAKEIAENANQAKDDFIAMMSHEIRTPLAAIIGNAEILLDDLKDADTRSILETIHKAGEGQLALVNDILDMSKIQSGKFDIEQSSYSFVHLINNVTELVSFQIKEKGLSLSINQLNKEAHLLRGDDYRIKQILLNFFSNAIKFSDHGQLTLTTSRTDEWLNISLEDQGIGIKSANLKRLFEPFEQEDNSISRRYGGTGLGLFISQTLAKLMGGKISASSTPGKGSIFTLWLPYQPTNIVDNFLTKSCPSIHLDKAASSTKRLTGKVLLAEDFKVLELLIRRMIENFGPTVTSVENGLEAFNEAAKGDYDLILMDMQMPEMDGIESTRKIREIGIQTPVIALTANVMQQHRDAFEEAGSNGFLSKPIDRQQLGNILQHYISP